MRCEYLRIGLIVRPHGVHGALKLMSLSSVSTRFSALCSAYIEDNGTYKAVKVISATCSTDGSVCMSIDGVDDRDAAEKLRGKYLCVDREHAAKLPDGQYYVAELIGCRVFDTTGKAYGILTDVYETGANDVYVVELDGGGTLSAPVIKKLLHSVSVENSEIVFEKDVLDEVGLFDE